MSSFLSHFPYPAVRTQQRKVIEAIEGNWNDYDFFIISAPTGIGKSAIAYTISRAAGRSYVLTSTKILQDQYDKEFREIINLKGKGNYACDLNPAFNVETAPCVIMTDLAKQCQRNNTCTYYRQRNKALTSATMLTSYAFFLPSVECGVLSDEERLLKNYGVSRVRDVVIYDEGHELEDKLVEFGSVTLDPRDLVDNLEVRVDPSTTFDDPEIYDQQISKFHLAMSERLQKLTELIQTALGNASEWAGSDVKKMSPHAAKQVRGLAVRRDRLDRMCKRLSLYRTWKIEDQWIIKSVDNGTKLRITPLMAKRLFMQFCGHMGRKHVIMSASIGDPETLVHELGLPPEKVMCLSVGSPFSPAKSPIFPICNVKLGYKDIDRNIPAVIESIATLLEEHRDEKGIIHSGNYKLTKAILERSPAPVRHRLIGKRETGFGTESNEELVERHIGDPRPTVLVSPSMSTGIDLRDEASRFQIIVKLPWLQTTDPRVEAKIKDGDWYVNEMVKRLIQASGRSTRSDRDHSVTYVLDQQFEQLIKRSSHLFPKWFLDRIQWE